MDIRRSSNTLDVGPKLDNVLSSQCLEAFILTVSVSEASMATNGELKHLSFVKDQTAFIYSKATELYAAGKGYVPAPINDVLAKAESLGAPVVSTLADNGEKALSVVDSRVSGGLRVRDRADARHIISSAVLAHCCSVRLAHAGGDGRFYVVVGQGCW